MVEYLVWLHLTSSAAFCEHLSYFGELDIISVLGAYSTVPSDLYMEQRDIFLWSGQELMMQVEDASLQLTIWLLFAWMVVLMTDHFAAILAVC